MADGVFNHTRLKGYELPFIDCATLANCTVQLSQTRLFNMLLALMPLLTPVLLITKAQFLKYCVLAPELPNVMNTPFEVPARVKVKPCQYVLVQGSRIRLWLVTVIAAPL